MKISKTQIIKKKKKFLLWLRQKKLNLNLKLMFIKWLIKDLFK